MPAESLISDEGLPASMLTRLHPETPSPLRGWRKSPSPGFYAAETEKCDFPFLPFSTAYGRRKWRLFPEPHRVSPFATPS